MVNIHFDNVGLLALLALLVCVRVVICMLLCPGGQRGGQNPSPISDKLSLCVSTDDPCFAAITKIAQAIC